MVRWEVFGLQLYFCTIAHLKFRIQIHLYFVCMWHVACGRNGIHEKQKRDMNVCICGFVNLQTIFFSFVNFALMYLSSGGKGTPIAHSYIHILYQIQTKFNPFIELKCNENFPFFLFRLVFFYLFCCCCCCWCRFSWSNDDGWWAIEYRCHQSSQLWSISSCFIQMP